MLMTRGANPARLVGEFATMATGLVQYVRQRSGVSRYGKVIGSPLLVA